MNEVERAPEVYRDHFAECWKHFAARFLAAYPSQNKQFEARKPIAEFCGLSPSGVKDWLVADRLPVGSTQLKLKCFLDLKGYRIIEFERLPKLIRGLSELIGYGVLKVEEVNQVIGYTQSFALYMVLRGDSNFGTDNEAKGWELWKSKREALEQKKRDAGTKYRIDLSKSTPVSLPVMVVSPAPAVPPANALATHRSGVLTLFEGLLALLNEGLFENLSERELTEMKEKKGGVILALSAKLSCLSSKLITERRV